MPVLRWSFPKLWQVSAALFVLTLAAAALSFRYRAAGNWTAHSERTYCRLSLVLGRLVVAYERDDIPDQPFIGTGWAFEFQRIPRVNEISDAATVDPTEVHFRFAGLIHWVVRAPDFVAHWVHIPLWLPLLIFAVLPAVAAYRRARARRCARRGLCTQCGYDLRASAGRCPECGAPINSNAETNAAD